ncbi:AzlC family ABC transporter permease [Photobacterium leiognathi]|uniref:AzlC family ABC transporter permease n=1 Tax=Photobacterium leiognathi TaxID=553611 RepID=UPI0029821461|nr:AzlC family ABC transporter permease [Photobacterium leiognathi]
MDITTSPHHITPQKIIFRATLDILPLCAAITPWGILCGSLAIQIGLTALQAQLLSLMVFAGAAQLAATSLLGAGVSYSPIFSSTFVISSRHLLYSAVFQKYIKDLSLPRRLCFAFFLTDEMFALTSAYIEKHKSFNYLYAISTGIVFYLMWNIATFAGIVIGNNITNFDALGLEFAIAATFIAIVIPSIKNSPILISVLTSGITVLVLELFEFSFSLIASTVMGMLAGYFTQRKGLKNES